MGGECISDVIDRLHHLTEWGWSAGDRMGDIKALLAYVAALEEEIALQGRLTEGGEGGGARC